MKKFSFSFLLLLVLLLAGLPAGVLPVSASTAFGPSVAPVNGIIPTDGINLLDDHYHHPPYNKMPYHPPKGAKAPVPVGPAEAVVQTVPPLADITLEIDGQKFVTGPDGTATVRVAQAGTYTLQVFTDTFQDPSRKVEFARWLGESFQPILSMHVPSPRSVQVGLNVYERVGQTFVGLDGKPVDPKRIQQFSVRSIQGDAFTFHDGQSRWLPATRVTRRRTGGLDVVNLLYSVTEVVVDGSNVVNKSQQQFYAKPNTVWPIALQLYTLHVQSTDALFGFAQGKSLQLRLPNGTIQTYPLDATGSAEVPALARGTYTAEFTGIKGLSTQVPVALSRDQQLVSRVISYLDLAVVGVFGAALALGLLLFGRPSLRPSLRKKNRSQQAPVYKQDKDAA